MSSFFVPSSGGVALHHSFCVVLLGLFLLWVVLLFSFTCLVVLLGLLLPFGWCCCFSLSCLEVLPSSWGEGGGERLRSPSLPVGLFFLRSSCWVVLLGLFSTQRTKGRQHQKGEGKLNTTPKMRKPSLTTKQKRGGTPSHPKEAKEGNTTRMRRNNNITTKKEGGDQAAPPNRWRTQPHQREEKEGSTTQKEREIATPPKEGAKKEIKEYPTKRRGETQHYPKK